MTLNSPVAARRSRSPVLASAGCCLVARLNFRRSESRRLVTLEDGEYVAIHAQTLPRGRRRRPWRGMILHRIFPRALPPVGVTSRFWLVSCHPALLREKIRWELRLRQPLHAVVARTWCVLALQRNWESLRVMKELFRCRSQHSG